MNLDFLRIIAPLALAFLTAWVVDEQSRTRRLRPPGFEEPLRRWVAFSLLALCFFIGVMSPLGQVGLEQEIDFTKIRGLDLFLIHALLLVTVLGWAALGFGAREPVGGLRVWARQLGLRARTPLKEVGIGLLAGVVLWPVVLIVSLVGALSLQALGATDFVPSEPPPMVVWIAGLPLLLRVAISLSAGFFEELFFRGFLQPRIGILISTTLFALAHLSYDQPFMLVGITLLSFGFAALTHWRQSIWAAVAAHTAFDALQLLVLIPIVLENYHDLAQSGLAGLFLP